MRSLLSLIVFTAALTAATPALATHELSLGHVDEIDGIESQGFVYSYRFPLERWKRYGLEQELLLGGINGRGALGGPEARDVYFVGAGLRMVRGRFFLGSATTLISRESSILSSRYQFVTAIGFTMGRWAFTARHLSNANTGGRNRGENMFTLGYTW